MHVVASARGGWRANESFDAAAWLWEHTGRALPDAQASNLLPDHSHHLAPESERTLDRLRRVYQQHTRLFAGPGQRWELHATPVSTRPILHRALPYLLVNPVKDGLIADPYAWLWSSLRDLVGAGAVPHGDPAALARALGVPRDRLLEWVHTRIVGHPSFRVRDPGVPRRDPRAKISASLPTIAEAVVAARRTKVEAMFGRGPTRSAVVALADQVGSFTAAELGDFVRVDPRSIRKMRGRPRPELGAELLCLADPRLRGPTTPQGPLYGTPATAGASRRFR